MSRQHLARPRLQLRYPQQTMIVKHEWLMDIEFLLHHSLEAQLEPADSSNNKFASYQGTCMRSLYACCDSKPVLTLQHNNC